MNSSQAYPDAKETRDISRILQLQDALQAEALAVQRDLQLDELLEPAGETVPVGSAALGLMVWRDIDLTVVSPRLSLEPVLTVLGGLVKHPRVRRVEFRNDAGAWKVSPRYPDGLYLGVGYRSQAGDDWKLDIWFVDQPDRQPDLAHMRWIPSVLTPETREAILLIKTAYASRPEYGKTVTSFDIYSAVLKHGARTREDFDNWLHQTKPFGVES